MASEIVGRVTLTERKRFTVYSETASRTDYVDCEPQTVDLRWVDRYWLCARFHGVLGATTYRKDSELGTPDSAGAQWSYAGFSPDALRGMGFDVELTAGRIENRGTYGPGCGDSTGKPIQFFVL